jgi:hypothetical protein
MKLKEFFSKLTRLRFPWPIKIVVTALVVYLVNKSFTKDQLSVIVQGISIIPLSVAFILWCMSLFCVVKRWKLILGIWGIPINDLSALRNMLWGCLLAFLTPGRVGEFFRGVSLSPLKKRNTIYAVLMEKIFAAGAILIFGAVCCAISLSWNGSVCWLQVVILLGWAAVMIGTGTFFMMRKVTFIRQIFAVIPTMSRKQTIALVFHSVSAHLFLLCQTAVLLSMFGSNDFMNNILTSGQAYSFMLFFPFFIANMGIREYSFGMFLSCGPAKFHLVGIPAIALGASMGILLINIILPAVAGLVWWLVDKKKSWSVGKLER